MEWGLIDLYDGGRASVGTGQPTATAGSDHVTSLSTNRIHVPIARQMPAGFAVRAVGIRGRARVT